MSATVFPEEIQVEINSTTSALDSMTIHNESRQEEASSSASIPAAGGKLSYRDMLLRNKDIAIAREEENKRLAEESRQMLNFHRGWIFGPGISNSAGEDANWVK